MKKICTKCGKEYSKKEKFCISCGGELVKVDNKISVQGEENKVISPAKKFLNVVLTVFIAIIIGLMIGIGILFALNVYQNRPVKYQDSILVQYLEDGVIVIAYGKSYHFDENVLIRYNIDKTSIALTDKNNTLYFINESGCSTISDNVDEFKISNNGNAIAFITSSIEDTLEINLSNVTYQHGELYLYNVDTQTNSLINSDVVYELRANYYNDIYIHMDSLVYNSIVISENGNSVGYISNVEFNAENDTISWQSYINTNGLENTFEKNSLFYAINDDTSCVYWNNLDKSGVYCANMITNETNKLASTLENNEVGLTFNKDYTECLVSYNDKTYISENCKDPKLICDFCMYNIYNSSICRNNDFLFGCYCVTALNIDTFSNNVFGDENAFYYLKKEKNDWIYEKINSNSTFVYTSLDSKYIYTIKNSNNSLVKTSTNSTEKEIVEIGKNVGSAVISSNEKYVYYIDKVTSDLYCFDGKTSTKIDYDVKNIFEYNNTFYYIKDIDTNGFGTLYCSSKGHEGVKVEHGIDVYVIKVSKDGAFFISIDDIDKNLGTLYQINNKTDAILIEENVYYY